MADKETLSRLLAWTETILPHNDNQATRDLIDKLKVRIALLESNEISDNA